eukprot:1336727-Amorphochlora_amoeboformis.AAC.1
MDPHIPKTPSDIRGRQMYIFCEGKSTGWEVQSTVLCIDIIIRYSTLLYAAPNREYYTVLVVGYAWVFGNVINLRN